MVPVSFSEAVGWPATCFTTCPLVPLGTSYCLSLSASSVKGGWQLSMWRSNCGLWWGFSELTSVISYCRARCWVSFHKGCWAGRRTLPSWTSWGNLPGKRPGPDCPRLYARLATRVFLINESLRYSEEKFFFLGATHSLRDLSCLSRDWTRVHGSESAKSYPLDRQGIPRREIFYLFK